MDLKLETYQLDHTETGAPPEGVSTLSCALPPQDQHRWSFRFELDGKTVFSPVQRFDSEQAARQRAMRYAKNASTKQTADACRRETGNIFGRKSPCPKIEFPQGMTDWMR